MWWVASAQILSLAFQSSWKKLAGACFWSPSDSQYYFLNIDVGHRRKNHGIFENVPNNILFLHYKYYDIYLNYLKFPLDNFWNSLWTYVRKLLHSVGIASPFYFLFLPFIKNHFIDFWQPWQNFAFFRK